MNVLYHRFAGQDASQGAIDVGTREMGTDDVCLICMDGVENIPQKAQVVVSWP